MRGFLHWKVASPRLRGDHNDGGDWSGAFIGCFDGRSVAMSKAFSQAYTSACILYQLVNRDNGMYNIGGGVAAIAGWEKNAFVGSAGAVLKGYQ